MKLFQLFSILLLIIQKYTLQNNDINVTTEMQNITININTNSISFAISLSPECTENYKFINIISNPIKANAKLYFSTTNSYPVTSDYNISCINNGKNQYYIPRIYFESTPKKLFYMSVFCDGACHFNISFQLVEMMYAEKSERLDFLTFDYEDYLIYFDKNENDIYPLMVTASGGAKGHHGSKNNAKLSLFYVPDEGDSISIDVNSKIMLNGAGALFNASYYSKYGKGKFIAKVRGPKNTYLSFTVREIGHSSDLVVDGKAIYGYLPKDYIDTFELKGYEIDKKIAIQVSIIVKGSLMISKSSNEFCEYSSEIIHVKDELQAIMTFTEEDLSNNITHICIQSDNHKIKYNAYIIEVNNVTDQKIETIITEPRVNGYIYTDYLKFDEVRSYRHSKYIGEGFTKYNAKLIEGEIKVSVVKCNHFPCKLSKAFINGEIPKLEIKQLSQMDKYYSTNIDKKLETNAYGPVQYLLGILCLTEKCKFEVSFSDEEDSLILKENERVAHYISPNSTNYYHFKISEFENAQKVLIYLISISGDSNIEMLDDATERKRYYMENTKILEFYDYEYTGLYTLNITGRIGSFYFLSYSVIRNNETEEDKINNIGFGISILEGIKYGNQKKIFQMSPDKTRNKNFTYISIFNPLNCKINVSFFDEDITPNGDIFQHVITVDNPHYNDKNLLYTVKLISFNDESSYENKFCLFHVTSQELSENSQSIISEGSSVGFVLTPSTKDLSFVYPHSAGKSDILIKYNLENSYPVDMNLKIDYAIQKGGLFSRSSSKVIPASNLNNCKNGEVCGIIINFSPHNKNLNVTIPMSIIIKSKDNVPSTLTKNKLQVDLVAENSTQYYMVDINPEDKGEIVINFKQGSGIMFAKMVGKNAEPEENSDWKYRVRLPTPEEKEDSVGEFDRYKNNIKYDATKLYKYGIPVCKNGCELYIGIKSTDIIKSDNTLNDYLEYSIYIRPEINILSNNTDKHQKLISQKAIKILANEYVTGYIEDTSDIHYYFFEVQDDSDYIEVEFQSESCSIYINYQNNYPEPDSSKWEINSKIKSSILTIKKEELDLDNLNGVQFKMAVNSNKNHQLMSMMYIFRIRMIKRSFESVIEINGNLATVCEIEGTNQFCDLLYPLSDYEFEVGNSLYVYAETDVITDIEIYFNPIHSFLFDQISSENMKKYLPRHGNCNKSTENQEIKNYIEITNKDLTIKDSASSNNKAYALISIKSNDPCIINIYTTMREQVLITAVNPYSKLLFQRTKNNPIIFYSKGDQNYNYYITCLSGEATAYFESEKKEVEKYKSISGSGVQFSLALPQKKEDKLIIEPTSGVGFIFYIYENIHPEVRQMELIKFGVSGNVQYNNENEIDFPAIYYMKIQNGDESLNVNLHINNLKTSFLSKNGGNYTNSFDIYGWVVDESMITSMMRSKRKNPQVSEAVRGQYDKTLSLAKLYFPSSQFKTKGKDIINYLVVSLNKNEHMYSIIESMKVHISPMPFNNKYYNSPYNLYITGNLLKNSSSDDLCNYHRLRVGNQGDKYMQIEIGILSSYIKFDVIDMNNRDINYVSSMKKENGKYKSVIELKSYNEILLKFCRNDNQVEDDSSLNYIFKIRSSTQNDFNIYNLDSSKVEFISNYNKSQSSLELKIPKILNRDKSKAVPANYYIRIYPRTTFDPKEDPNTISFISYYPFATYIYKILEDDEDDLNINPITRKIENIPDDKAYIISIIGVANSDDNEEIYSYETIIDPFNKDIKKGSDEKNYYFIPLGISIAVVCVLLAGTIYFVIRMNKKKKDLEEEIAKIGGSTKRSLSEQRDNYLSDEYADLLNT